MTRRHVRQAATGAQVEVRERPYEQHMGRPQIEVTLWRSIDDCRTLVFEETDPARKRVEPAKTVLGSVPAEMVSALDALGYEMAD